MQKKLIFNHSLISYGWFLVDPTNETILEEVDKKNIREGEERLMLAVLESAVEDFQKYVLARHPSGKKLFQEAEEWFFDKDSEELFSFRSICEALALHPDSIRKGLMVWKEAKLKTVSDDAQPARRPKLARSRFKHPSVRLSKTA
jgi:hypothetical protein